MNEMNDLFEILNDIRDEEFDHIPKELLHKIIEIEKEFQNDRTEANKRISKIVELFLKGGTD